ncbi:putative bifunctional methylenetetrahydrofolate dehydrogenase/cyclohydrolase 2 [Camelus dromedarius]|uniref:Putative bifunctional methylenetetrahydrofolate dehydrogenase/cyclohydrolase 2 n=1 Tax=Camelus dromedarius TaxID=9838 RepID=A0A5N4EG77_CAMDR|nr:putative bifunctional methylenetetrahydrofolate dehydrogenase/cyclohydrolase 2 [Camelus dromedarius]
MTVSARGFWLLRGRLGQVPALGGSAVPPLAAPAPGAAGRAFRGFRSSCVRYERSRTLDLGFWAPGPAERRDSFQRSPLSASPLVPILSHLFSDT